MDGRRLLSVGLVGGLLLAAALATFLVFRAERIDDRLAARQLADQAASAVTPGVRTAAASLRGVDGLVSVSGRIDARTFRAFARGVLAEETLVVIGWGPLVTAAERPAFERRAGTAIRAPDSAGGLTRRGAAPRYLPIELLAPGDSATQRALGFDQFSQPDRAAAARAAIDFGTPQVTAPLTLVATQRPGVTVFQAVYRPGAPVRTRAERRRAALGAFGAALAVERLEGLIRAQLPRRAQLQVYDGRELLIGTPARMAATRRVEVLGRTWTVGVVPASSSSHALPLVIGVGGLLLAVLAAAVLVVAHRRERTLEIGRALAQRVAQRDALLLRIGAIVDRPGGMGDKLDRFAELLVAEIADVCLVDQLDDAGVLRRVSIAAARPGTVSLLRELPVPQAGSRQVEVVRRGEPVLLAEIPEDLLPEVSRDGAGVAVRRAIGVGSMMILPLAAQGVVTGAITLGAHRDRGRAYTKDDLAVGEQIAQRASLALDHARLYEREHDIATTLQRALLPSRLPKPPGLEVGVRYRPAGSGVMVGGDFYDVFEGAEGWIAVVGDVRGKGAQAAAITALVRHTLRARAATDGIVAALGAINTALRDLHDDELFCSLAAIEFTRDALPGGVGRVLAAVAGHPAPMILRADRSVEELTATGSLLGPLEDPPLQPCAADLHPGDTLLLYTDGVTEARRDGEQFGEERLRDAIRGAPRGSISGLLTHLEYAAATFAGGLLQDDIAIVALRVPVTDGGAGHGWGSG